MVFCGELRNTRSYIPHLVETLCYYSIKSAYMASLTLHTLDMLQWQIQGVIKGSKEPSPLRMS